MTAYDDIPYLSEARSSSHPDRMGALGRLFGLAAADPTFARILELGAGDGGNLIPIALSLPGSRCLGIDLSATAIARAAEGAAACGIGNVTFEVGDLANPALAPGVFDYVICHGVYSWVPESVRAPLLGLISRCLAPGGVAFVSYTALPGGHIQQMLREMLLFHTRNVESPGEKIRQARALLALLEAAPPNERDPVREILRTEVQLARRFSDFFLYHNNLAETNDGFYFTDFVQASGEHRLQFLCEASFHEMSTADMPPELNRIFSAMERDDLILKEQYLDFVNARRFRQTLLCRENEALDRRVDTARMRQFLFQSGATEAGEAEGEVEFRHANGSTLKSAHAGTINIFRLLIERAPAFATFADLLVAWGSTTAADEESLAEVLFRTLDVGLVGVRLTSPPASVEPGPRPLASPWARYRHEGERVTNLYHENVALDDDARTLLPLLDGDRDASTLAGDVGWPPERVRETLVRIGRLGLLTSNGD